MSRHFTESQKGFHVELLNLFHRWQLEGDDMTAIESLEVVQSALNEWLEEDVVIFEPDDNLEIDE